MSVKASSNNVFTDYSYLIALRGLPAWPCIYTNLTAVFFALFNQTAFISDVYNNSNGAPWLRYCLVYGLDPVPTLKTSWTASMTNIQAATAYALVLAYDIVASLAWVFFWPYFVVLLIMYLAQQSGSLSTTTIVFPTS